MYATSRVARIVADDRESAKRRFAAYALYDDETYVASDVVLAVGLDAEVCSADDVPQRPEFRDDLRAWLARRDAECEPFEVGLYEDAERSLDPYLRALATNDPWRLEGHGSRGRTLSGVAALAELSTFDGRVRHAFDAARYLDYVRLETIRTLDVGRPSDSIRLDALVDVCALEDAALRQIVSSYETIATELRLTARYAREPDARRTRSYDVTFAPDAWRAYVAHRVAEPDRFLPPRGWTSPFSRYD